MGAGGIALHQHDVVSFDVVHHLSLATSSAHMGTDSRCIGFVLALCMDVTAGLLHLLSDDHSGPASTMGHLASGQSAGRSALSLFPGAAQPFCTQPGVAWLVVDGCDVLEVAQEKIGPQCLPL